MFLTKIIIGYEQCVLNKLFDVYNIHQFVYKLFCNKKREFTFSFEFIDNELIILVYSQNEQKIDEFKTECTFLTENYFGKEKYNFFIKINSAIRRGEQYHPVKSKDFPDWIKNKFLKEGMIVLNLENFKNYNVSFAKPGNKDQIKHFVTSCTGIIQVQDKEKFKMAVTNGVGRSRAFGLGMLLVKPTNS